MLSKHQRLALEIATNVLTRENYLWSGLILQELLDQDLTQILPGPDGYPNVPVPAGFFEVN